MLSLPGPKKPSPTEARVPVRRCYADLWSASGLVIERRCFGEVIQGGYIVFADPEHPFLEFGAGAWPYVSWRR